MIDIPWILTSRDRLMLRIGTASYGTVPPSVRATALAIGDLATPADIDGMTATVAATNEAINLRTNLDRRAPYTMGETLAALAWLRQMDLLHETARVIGSARVHLIDCRGLVGRAEPVLDFCGPEPGYDVGIKSDWYPYGEQAA